MTDQIYSVQCRECKRRRDIRQMVRVIAPDIEEDSFCHWECFWRYYTREFGEGMRIFQPKH